MNARTILSVAFEAGITFSLDGDKLALRCATKPPDSLLDAIKEHKANIMTILKRGVPGVAVAEPVEEPPAAVDAEP